MPNECSEGNSGSQASVGKQVKEAFLAVCFFTLDRAAENEKGSIDKTKKDRPFSLSSLPRFLRTTILPGESTHCAFASRKGTREALKQKASFKNIGVENFSATEKKEKKRNDFFVLFFFFA